MTFVFYSGLPNYRSRETPSPAQEVRAAVPAVGHVQVSGDQGAARAHTGGRHADQEDDGARRHGAAHRADHVALLPEPQRPGLRPREPDSRGRGRPDRTGCRVRAAHRRHVGRLLVVRATGRRDSVQQRLQGLQQEPVGRHEGLLPTAAVK